MHPGGGAGRKCIKSKSRRDKVDGEMKESGREGPLSGRTYAGSFLRRDVKAPGAGPAAGGSLAAVQPNGDLA